MPMTEDWLRHLDDLASKSPSDPDTIFEFRPGFEATPSDVQEQILAEAETPLDPLHPGSTPIPYAASSPERAPSSPAAALRSPERTAAALPSPTPRVSAPPALPVAPRRVSFGPALAPASPASTAVTPTNPVSPAKPALKAPVVRTARSGPQSTRSTSGSGRQGTSPCSGSSAYRPDSTSQQSGTEAQPTLC